MILHLRDQLCPNPRGGVHLQVVKKDMLLRKELRLEILFHLVVKEEGWLIRVQVKHAEGSKQEVMKVQMKMKEKPLPQDRELESQDHQISDIEEKKKNLVAHPDKDLQ